MRTKNYNLLKRGRKWYLRYDIPADVRSFFPEIKSRTREEALKTTDEKEARRLRNLRLGQLERSWNILRERQRLGRKSGVNGAEISSWEEWASAISSSHAPDDMEALDISLSDAFDRRVEDTLRQRRIPNFDFDARERVAVEIKASPYGQRLARALLIAEGTVTPISEVAEEWLRNKGHLNASSLSTYRKALRVLQERFHTVEEVTRRAARNYLSDLLQGLNKRTVGQYLIPYRGVWEHADKDASIWSTKGMDGPIKSTPILSWNDDEYLKLLAAAETKGFRDMWLAVRIAAHTGGAAQGIASLTPPPTHSRHHWVLR